MSSASSSQSKGGSSRTKDPSLYASNGKLHVGRMMHKCATSENMPEQSWCNVPGTSFDTRIGPDYAQNKKKDTSKPCIYECAAIDLYTTETKMSHVGRLVDLPGEHLDDSQNNGYLPSTFIVNFQIPNYPLENAIWGTCAGDGPGYSLVFYFVLSEYGRNLVAKKGKLESAADDADSSFYGSLSSRPSSPKRKPEPAPSGFASMFSLGGGSSHHSSSTSHHHHSQHHRSGSQHHNNNPTSASSTSSTSASSAVYYSHTDPSCFTSRTDPTNAAVRLLHNFVAAEEGSDLRQRFKAITRMMNVDDVGLGGATKKLVTMYNATPFLIRTCSVFWRGERYFEVDVDVHRFSYTARLGLSGVRERIKDVVFDFGFVIEGHSDFELPENMLGAVRLSKLDLSLAKPFPV